VGDDGVGVGGDASPPAGATATGDVDCVGTSLTAWAACPRLQQRRQ
jgi:hypothetical protein